MRKIVGLFAWCIPSVSHAAGLQDLITGASPDAKYYVYGVLAIFAVCIVGKAGGLILSGFGDGRGGRLMSNGSYLAAIGIFMSLALMLFKQFCTMVVG
ncbi:MAG: hypothetical protein H6Q73_218 [Firmicutes bacterium]|nr:hypothetical protein [Bacillota bacterium]